MKQLFATIALLLSAMSIMAQQKMTWDNQGISFESTETLTVNNMDAYEYGASNATFNLGISVFQDERSSNEGMANATKQLAEMMEYKNASDATLFEKGTLKGYYIVGDQGDKRSLLMTIRDTRKGNNLLVTIGFDKKQESTAIALANSFQAIP